MKLSLSLLNLPALSTQNKVACSLLLFSYAHLKFRGCIFDRLANIWILLPLARFSWLID